MKKSFFVLAATILTCQVFNFFHLTGTQAIMDLSQIVAGLVYLQMSVGFFKDKQHKAVNRVLGLVMVAAAAFSILPILIYLVNGFTFIININYNDILFNYYKSYLNSLLGLILFAGVCIIHYGMQLKEATNEKEKKNYKLLIAVTVFFVMILFVLAARKFGLHISYSRIVLKITLLISLLLILPYSIYSGVLKNKLFGTFFLGLMLTFLNALPAKVLFSADFAPTRWFAYTKTVRPASPGNVDTLKTISSLKELGNNFYEMNFYGDYTNILEENNRRCTEESINPGHYCSLFTASGDSAHYLFGRSFDNPQGWKCKTLLCRTQPVDGYASMSLVRMADIGFDISENMKKLSYTDKLKLLNAVYWTPDGMNEKGLVVAMAAVENRILKLDTSKAFINCSYLVREILDHAKDVEEAMVLIKKYNVMNDVWQGSFDQHMIIADASGRSVIAEISDGEFRFISDNNAPWLVTTNSPSYNVSLPNQKSACPRFKAISERMEATQGNIDPDKALELLKQVGHQYTEWSVVYDISQKKIKLAVDYDFTHIYNFSFEK